MRTALTTKDLESRKKHHAANEKRYPKKVRELATKTWNKLSDKEKDSIMRHLAIRFGLVKEDE